LVSRGAKSLIEEAQEQPKSNGPLVKLHAKLVTVLWIIMGLDMKSIKPLTLFDTAVMLCSLALFVLVCFNNVYLLVHGNGGSVQTKSCPIALGK